MPETRAEKLREERELAYDIKFLLVILLLFVFYPVGLILMWVWMAWPTWLKLLISLPVLLFLFMIFMGFVFFLRVARNGWSGNYPNGTPMMRYYRGYYYPGGGRRMPMMQYYYQNGGANPSTAPSPTVSPVPSSY